MIPPSAVVNFDQVSQFKYTRHSLSKHQRENQAALCADSTFAAT
jgi:hypothetical protein